MDRESRVSLLLAQDTVYDPTSFYPTYSPVHSGGGRRRHRRQSGLFTAAPIEPVFPLLHLLDAANVFHQEELRPLKS